MVDWADKRALFREGSGYAAVLVRLFLVPLLRVILSLFCSSSSDPSSLIFLIGFDVFLTCNLFRDGSAG